MFGRPKIDITLIQTTSRDALKRSALFASGGDVKQAEEIYNFFVKDMPNMPDYDTIPPTFMEQAKSTIGGVLGWVDENQDKLVGYWNIIQQMRGGGAVQPPVSPTNLPPI